MDERDEQAPLRDLEQRLEKARRSRPRAESRPANTAGESGRNAPGIGRVGLELVAAAVLGLLIGVGIDRWLGTKPAGFILFFVLGIAAGMVNVWRAAMGMGAAVGYRRQGSDQAEGKTNKDWSDED